MRARRIAVLNAGASTLKIALLECEGEAVKVVQRSERSWRDAPDRGGLVAEAVRALQTKPDAFGHRVVHGGARTEAVARIDAALEAELAALVDLAPLHNAIALEVLRVSRELHPGIPAFAAFDTAFHAHRPPASMHYALPPQWVDAFAIRRYGFHGIAHASLVAALARAEGRDCGSVSAVTLQLGAGCSACAVQGGRSLETSMGFTPLEGLVMTTRSGDIDPAIVLRLVRAGHPADEIEEQLLRRSGLAALAGSGDVREVLAAAARGDARARLALDVFVHRIVLTVGAYFTLLDGRGALVFGGGIGTNSPLLRTRIAAGLTSWGVRLDETLNAAGREGRIASDGRPVYAFRTDEESIIAADVAKALDG